MPGHRMHCFCSYCLLPLQSWITSCHTFISWTVDLCCSLFSFPWMGQLCRKLDVDLKPLPSTHSSVMHPPLVPPWEGAHLAAVLVANMETLLTTLSEVIRGQGPPADWSSSLTFSWRNPLLTPQLTSTSAPLLEEQRGRPPPPYLFILYLFPFIIFCLGTPRLREIAVLFH